MKRVTRRFAAWIACFAMLFAALAPSLSHAMSASRGDARAEICSVGGMKFVSVGVDALAGADSSAHDTVHLEHCPFCATHAGSFVLPSPAGLTIALADTRESLPFLFLRAPHPLAIWTVAQSRAPPASA
ncbi:MAG: DUF2946 domain-containing protein [Massilia sp.]